MEQPMKHVYLLGYPVGHSISPPIYNATFPAMGIDAACEAWATPPEDLAAVVADLRDPDCFGASVTIPHKEAVLLLLDEVDAGARAIGAVNCIVNRTGRLAGYNTDRYGFLRSLRESGYEAAGGRAVVLGAGGSARAVVAALVGEGVALLTLTGRSAANLSEVAQALRLQLGAADATLETLGWDDAAFAGRCREANLIVNCTPVGMWGSGLDGRSPIDRSLITPGATVLDLVYNPSETPLLGDAKAVGARPVGGLEMLVYQAAENLRLWTGREPPIDIMREVALKAISERH